MPTPPAVGGIAYFAMEYLPGARAITQFAGEKGLDLRRRVELFVKVCDAVHHGHQRGVIHRDLKPANILVAGGVGILPADAEPKVIDFGVARGTDSDIALTTQQTHLGELVGTMQYMSPEQCDGDPHEIDTRSDVYSLGVVLYELLAGTPPYDVSDSTIYQATRVIKERYPERPSAAAGVSRRMARRLRGDLDTIVLKAIEKDRDRRYASAAALGDDLRRWLAGEPIMARRATVWARAVRWAYRRPAATLLALSAAASALIVFGAVFVGWYWGWYTGWKFSNQPVGVEIVDKGSELRIRARNGTQRTWMRDRSDSFDFAKLLEPELPTRPMRPLLVGVGAIESGKLVRGLHVFDADGDLSNSQVVRQVEPALIPDVLRKREDCRFETSFFGVVKGLVANVFAEIPGDEIIVAFQHVQTTQTMIAVFDLEWRQRYGAWLDAQIDSLFWMAGARRLVLLGSNGQYFLSERGLEYQLRGGNHVKVIFAIELELDFKKAEYIAQEVSDRAAAERRLRPVWYWMLPVNPNPGRTQDGDMRLLDADGDGRHVAVEMEVEGQDPDVKYGAKWILDENGEGERTAELSESVDLYRTGKRPGFEGMKIPERAYFRLEPLKPPREDVKKRPQGSASPKE